MNKTISFPHLGSYYIPIKYIIEKITKCKVILSDINNSNIVKLGSMYSPNDICMPFKYNLGNYINALRKGANILVQAGGGCRYGYYAELQEQILHDLGYEFEFINLIKNNHISLKKLYQFAKKLNPKINLVFFSYYLLQGFIMIWNIDKLEKYKRENYYKIQEKEKFNKIRNSMLKYYSKNKLSIYKIIKMYLNTKRKYKKLTKNEYEPVKILLIGELYTLMDNAANNDLENKLLENNIKVYRYTDLSYLLFKKKISFPIIMNQAKKYLKYSLGADGAESVAHTITHCKTGIDGIIHLKSYSCVPEINAMPILSKICEDYQVPIIYLSYDGENNISNIDTKLEAFYDMIIAKKKQK